MRKTALSLFIVCAALISLIPATAAWAACRPTTLADHPPPPATQPLAPSPIVPSTTLPSTPTTDTTAVTTTTIPAVPTEVTATTAPVVYTPRRAICSYVYRMQWPILGGGAVGSVFGAERDGGTRLHAGVDVMAPKMSPIVAVRDGTITRLHASGPECCWMILTHDDGWASWYVHLNNDVDGSDNGHGVGIRPGLTEGTRLVAGEVIGWVGDSGNAEPGPPHLHFELHTSYGVAIDPLASLRWAYRQMPAPALEDETGEFAGPYVDDDGSAAEPIFALLTSVGAMTSCDEWGVQVCPDLAATNLDAATWIGSLGSVLVPTNPKTNPATIIHDIIFDTLACPEGGCAPEMITAGDVAAMLVWAVDQKLHDEAVGLGDASDGRSIVLPPMPAPYWEMNQQMAWAELVRRGLANDCPFTAPLLDALLSRATLAEMAARAFGYLPAITCGDLS